MGSGSPVSVRMVGFRVATSKKSSPGSDFAWFEYPHRAGVELAPADFVREPPGRLVVGLAGERERAPVDPEKLGSVQVDPRLERFLRRDVDRLRELSRRVGTDRQRGQVERPQRVTDLLEVPVVPGVRLRRGSGDGSYS